MDLRIPTLFALALLVNGCGGSGGGSDAGAPDRPVGLDARPTNASCTAIALHPSDAGVEARRAFTRLSFNGSVTGLYQAPGDTSQWYITLQPGTLYRFANDDETTTSTTITGLPAVDAAGEGGLLSLAFHPDFASNRLVYLSYTSSGPSESTPLISHVTRYTLNGNALANPREILTLNQPARNHNGGNIAFGPDGYLYIGFGDGGDSNDTFGNGQNPLTWHSKILRIQPSTDNTGAAYTVPADNPFVGNTAYLPEIWAQGFRNPWRFSFDRQTGALWVADVGQNAYEEVNLVTQGENYGWPLMEGLHCYLDSTCDSESLALPRIEYDHDSGCAITGGFVYRGTQVPALQGKYLYSDYCTSNIQGFSANTSNPIPAKVADAPALGQSATTFGEAINGEILVGTAYGRIYRLAVASDTNNNTIPTKLSEHPCFASTAPLSLASSVIAFDLNSPLWSDHAAKERYLALPDGATLRVNSDGDFSYPVGTVLIKHFAYGGAAMETRLLMHHTTGWAGYSYRWNEEQTDAELIDTAQSRPIDDEYTHVFPSPTQCFQCHTEAANTALGPEAGQLNRDFTYPSTGRTANQLDTWEHIGLFSSNLSTVTRQRYFPGLDDGSASLAHRARSYLHSNCSGCHRPNGYPSHFDLRYDTPFSQTGLCNGLPNAGNLGIDNARLITPGSIDLSILYQRMARRDSYQMPPLATQQTDDEALTVIAEWISNMHDCSN